LNQYKKYDDRIEEPKDQISDYEERGNDRIAEAQERTKAADEETEELKEKLETEIKFSAQEPAKLAAAQKTKLEESGKLIAYLQNESKKLKGANDTAKKEIKNVKETACQGERICWSIVRNVEQTIQ
jgi:chromosome segregation ATPase